MNKWIKKLHWHFIPSHENSFQPHSLRLPAAAGILGLIVAVEALYLVGTFVILPSSNYFAAVFASVLVDQTNGERQTEALNTLKTNPVLERAALMKAQDMASKGYFAHNSPEGKTPWYWFEQVGYNYAAAGENLAVNFVDSKDVTSAWMQSPTHRANIMSGNYTEIGIAVVSGMYKGREAIFVVQEFGRPSLVAQNTDLPDINFVTPTPTPTPVQNKPEVKPTALPPAIKKVVTKPVVEHAPTTTTVAGAETQKLPAAIDMSDPVVPEPVVLAANLNAQDPTKEAIVAAPKPLSPIGMLVASPRQITTTIYFVLAAFLAIALALAVFIKIRIQHPHLIANGVLLIAITLSFVLLNSAIGFTQGMI